MSKPTIAELINVLLPLLPNAEVTEDTDGWIVIYAGLNMPEKGG